MVEGKENREEASRSKNGMLLRLLDFNLSSTIVLLYLSWLVMTD